MFAGLLALVLTGCGSSKKSTTSSTQAGSTTSSTASTTVAAGSMVHLTKAAYERKMRLLGNMLGESVEGLYPLSSGTKGSDIAKKTILKLQKTEGVAKTVLQQMQHIAPPTPVTKEQSDLEGGVSLLINQLDVMISSAQTGDVATFIQGSNFGSSLRAINTAANAMTDVGYNILGKDAAINP